MMSSGQYIGVAMATRWADRVTESAVRRAGFIDVDHWSCTFYNNETLLFVLPSLEISTS